MSVEYEIIKAYKINGSEVNVIAQVSKNNIGCYFAELMYESFGNWKKTEITMNGPGKSKLEKKIKRFLISQL